MTVPPSPSSDSDRRIGVLLSGGLDSAILLGWLLNQGQWVQPFYIRCGLRWESAERAAVAAYLAALARPALAPLVEFALPLADVYGPHWSVAGNQFPGFDSPDEEMYLPGRNALLLVKPVIYCQLEGIGRLAMAPLGTSPFPDAKPEFFGRFFQSLNQGVARGVTAEIPFAQLTKRDVMRLGQQFPLELTFSCIAPAGGLHCGRCNKCAERQSAFAQVGWADPTRYAEATSAAGPLRAGG